MMSPDLHFDPTRTEIETKELGSEDFSENAIDQAAISERLLKAHFPGALPILVQRVSAGRETVWDFLEFIDDREKGQTKRALYTVRFSTRRGPRVTLEWQEILELYDRRNKATYHDFLPHPPFHFSNLRALKAQIVDPEGSEGKAGDVIELEVVAEGESRAWQVGYVPVFIQQPLQYLEFQLGTTWHEAYPGCWLLTWKDFLRAYEREEYPWADRLFFMGRVEALKKFIFSAIKEKDIIPFGNLVMIGVGPLEGLIYCDVMDDLGAGGMMDDLEAFERETQDPELRRRLHEMICGIYVDDHIFERWKTLVKKCSR